jgi:hypothetical protein
MKKQPRRRIAKKGSAALRTRRARLWRVVISKSLAVWLAVVLMVAIVAGQVVAGDDRGREKLRRITLHAEIAPCPTNGSAARTHYS